eukprot:Gb_41187 [translate_table: standard]
MAAEFGLSSGIRKTFVNYAAFLALLVIICVKGCPVEERQALLSFRASFIDSNAHLKSWEGVDCCRWRGVNCSYGEAKHVVTLDLHGFHLSTDGQIDSSLFQLRQLRYLDLSLNSFDFIKIPQSLGLLRNLTYLNMSYSGLEGDVPSELGNLSSLHLSGNELQGSIPPSMGNLLSLTWLHLSKNELSGSIPSSLGNLFALSKLYLSENELGGSFPPSFAKLSSLTILDVSQNQLNNNIASSFTSLPSSLQQLSLSSNNMVGTIPEAFFDNLVALTYLDLSDSGKLSINVSLVWIPTNNLQLQRLNLKSCEIGGPFPMWLSTQFNIDYLDLSSCDLVGDIPSWVQNFKLEELLLSNNHLSGHIPPGLCVEFLDISNNDITGNIPVSLATCQNLTALNVANNQLEGFIPEEFGMLQSLNSLHIENNRLRGSIPSTLSNCTQLQVLDLGNNAFTGNIPSWIANLSQLRVLSMRSIFFGGKIPSEIAQLSNLQVLDLSANLLSATIPPTIFNLSAMKQVQTQGSSGIVGNNFLDGPGYYKDRLELIVKGRDAHYEYVLSSLTCIDVSNNQLRGHLPLEIEQLKGLMILNVSKNHLSSPIPKCLGDLT